MRGTRRAFVVAAAGALAGCNVLPEESDPVEGAASTPAVLSESAGYDETAATEETIEPTVTVEFSGDVQITNRVDVIATVYRRIYEGEGGRFGLVTAPALRVVEEPEVVRDPVTALDPPREVELATGLSVDDVGQWREATSATMLGTEATVETATATPADGGTIDLRRARVRAGGDSVTAMASVSDPPFGEVTRDAEERTRTERGSTQSSLGSTAAPPN